LQERELTDSIAKAALSGNAGLKKELFDQLGSITSSDLPLLDQYLREEEKAYHKKSTFWTVASLLLILVLTVVMGLLTSYVHNALGLSFDILLSLLLALMMVLFLLWVRRASRASERRLEAKKRSIFTMRREQKLRLYARLQVEEQEIEKWSRKHMHGGT
jgi:hypothetical protein